jgi:signal transduction histidine kinase
LPPARLSGELAAVECGHGSVFGDLMIESPRDRRIGPGRRLTDRASHDYDPIAVRGLLHDVGHQVVTLSYLVESVRTEADLPGGTRQRIELLAQEMSRLLELIETELRVAPPASDGSRLDLRPLARQVARLARVRHGVSVEVLPGPDMTTKANPLLLWRVLTNVVDNAARAAAPGGRVEISLRDQEGPAIDVADDGPGFGQGPPGSGSLGLSVVTSLLDACGGSLAVQSRQSGGTLVHIRLPAVGRGGRRAMTRG